MPSAEPSPRPWRITHPGEIDDANGNLLYNLRYCIGGGVDEANVALIVDAVNECDRLRDIVRRLSRHLANYITSESENDLLREARAAIWEDRP